MTQKSRKTAAERKAKAKRVAIIIFWGESVPQKVMHFYIYMIMLGAVLLYLPVTMGLTPPPGEPDGFYKVVADDYFVPGQYSGLAQTVLSKEALDAFFADPANGPYYLAKPAADLVARVYVIKDGMSGVYKAVSIEPYTFWDAILSSVSAFSDTGITPLTVRDTYSWFGQAVLMALVQIGGIGFVVICFLLWKTFFARRKDHSAFSKSIILAAERGNSKIGDATRTIVVSVSIIFLIEFLFAVFFSLYFAFVPAHEMMVLGAYLGNDPGVSRIVQNVSQIAVDNPNEMIYVYRSPMAIWAGVVQSMSSINNAGFDILGTYSLAPYRNDVHATFLFMTMVESFIGGIGYPVLFDVYEKIRRRRSRPGERYRFSMFTKAALWGSLVVSVIGFVLAAAIELKVSTGIEGSGQTLASAANAGFLRFGGGISPNPAAVDAAMYGRNPMFNATWRMLFQSQSVRGAGFSTDVGYLYSDSTKAILSVLMFVGASPSSTAGGIRTTTIAVLWAAIWAKMRGHKQTRMFGRAIPESTVSDSFICFFLGVFLLVLFSSVTLAVMDAAMPGAQYRFIDVVYEFTSAFGTVGMSVGLSTQLTKIVEEPLFLVVILMVVGQLGISNSLLVWAGRNPKGNLYAYPYEDIRIG